MKKIRIFILIFLIFVIPFKSYITKSELVEESQYKIFLNKFIIEDPESLNLGKQFILNFPNSKKIPDVLFFLSFIDKDYFNCLVYLKRIIYYYEDSIWWEDSIKRAMDFYLINGNYIAIKDYYGYYIKNSKTKRLRYYIEILYLKALLELKEISLIDKIVDNILITSSNYELLSFALYLKGKILFDFYKNSEEAFKYFYNNFYFFSESENRFNNLLYLYKISNGDLKIFFAKKIINENEIIFLDKNLINEINNYSKREIYNIKNIDKYLKNIIDNIYKRDYYYISVIVIKNDLILGEDFKKSFNLFSSIINKYELNLYFIKNDFYTIYGIGPFHFKDDALKIIEKIKNDNINGYLVPIEYNY